MSAARTAIGSFFQLTLIRLALYSLLFCTLCRTAWFLCNLPALHDMPSGKIVAAFTYGIWFDLPVIAYFFLPLWLFLLFLPALAAQKPTLVRILFIISAAAIGTLNGIDCIYSPITGKRSGSELFDSLSDEGNHLLPYFRDYWPAMLLLLFVLFLTWTFAPVQGRPIRQKPIHLYIISILCFAAVWIAAARGGWGLKPLRSLNAGEYVPPTLSPLVSSTPLHIMSSLGQNPIPEFRFMSEDKMLNWTFYQGEFEEVSTYKYGKYHEPKPNIVIIIVESLGREFLGYSNGTTLTPFLDSLSKKSLNFDYCYANGTRSKEMLSSIFCGIPSLLDDDYISSMYAGNKLENAFAKFAKCGYSTGFFHGGENGTMDFQTFLASTGPNTYYGRDQYPNQADYDGAWGIYDEPYLQYFARCLDTMRKPFFTSVFTLSSHEPYSIPEKYKGRFSDTGLPIYKTIQYTDLALRNFFAYAQKQPWFSNTIFVITGDHTTSGKNDYFYSTSGHYEVPLLIYSKRKLYPSLIPPPPITTETMGIIERDPSSYWRVYEKKTVAQTDIVPTLLAMAGCPDLRLGIGHNIFHRSDQGFSFNRQNGLWYIISYPYALGIDENGKVQDFHRRFRNKTMQEQLPLTHPEREWMEKKLKAHLQLFSKSLRENSWD